MKLFEINVLPEELRIREKEKKPLLSGLPSLEIIVPVAVGVIVFSHLLLGVSAHMKKGRLRRLHTELETLQPQKESLREFDTKFATLSKKLTLTERMSADRVLWAPKLQALSLHLPRGIWFREIVMSPVDFVLSGTVISLDKDEMSLIREFVDRLQDDREFIADFQSFELGTVQKKVIVYYDVTDFILRGRLHKKEQ
ncbi:MAG: hypothetical protein MJA29_06385 [Candidatus Omnitrophica bacterium]|nr:hypothetical protein [Candidatus Omnitrophota bacterium]